MSIHQTTTSALHVPRWNSSAERDEVRERSEENVSVLLLCEAWEICSSEVLAKSTTQPTPTVNVEEETGILNSMNSQLPSGYVWTITLYVHTWVGLITPLLSTLCFDGRVQYTKVCTTVPFPLPRTSQIPLPMKVR